MPSLKSKKFRELLRIAMLPDPVSGTADLEKLVHLFYSEDGELAAHTQIEPLTISGIKAEWITTSGVEQDKVFYYLHGGGYVSAYNKAYRRMLSYIVQASGVRVFALDYRLAPIDPFPAALEDAVTGYKWLLSQGFKPANIVIGGDSAGGGLTVATLLTLQDAAEPLPKAQVLISPWCDLEGTGESMTTRKMLDPFVTYELNMSFAICYSPQKDFRNPLISPIYADMHNLPPMQVFVGDYEVLLDDAIRLTKAATMAGVETKLKIWDEMWHVFPIHVGQTDIPEVQQSIEEIGAYLKVVLW
jgi:acetyl esterase/lipase